MTDEKLRWEQIWERDHPRLAKPDPESYERELAAECRQIGAIDRGVAVEEAWIVGSYPDTVLILMLSDEARPGCRFGKWKRIWNVVEGDPVFQAAQEHMYLMEYVGTDRRFFSLPCEPGEVTWPFGDPPVAWERPGE